MILGVVSIQDVGVVCGIAVAVVTIASIIGKNTSSFFKDRADKRHFELQMRLAFTGKPADEFGPEVVGIVKQMTTLASTVEKLSNKVDDDHDVLERHLRSVH